MPNRNSVALLSITASALVLSACSTVPHNPNYEFSSKYGQPGTDTVQVAEAWPETPTETAPIQQSQPTLASTQAPAPSTSPTEQAYNADQMVGTPGYEMMRAQAAQQAAPAPQPQPMPAPTTQVAGPREVTYDYAQNIIGQTTPAPTTIDAPPVPSTAVNVPTGYSYVVQPGDTVYSLSRSLCVAITDITVPNGIGSDYAISIGQSLTLPSNRC